MAASDFATAYRAHVLPRLREAVSVASMAFWADDLSFGDIATDVWGVAHRHGADFLPDDHRDILRDWLYSLLTEQIDAAEEIQRTADALVRNLLREPSRAILRERVRGFVRAG